MRYSNMTTSTTTDTNFDRLVQAWQARFTGGLSPASLLLAYYDWLLHFSNTPGNQARLFEQAWQDALRFVEYTMHSADPNSSHHTEPRPQDQRFASEDWKSWPFNLISQSFLMTEKWWQNATTGILGVSKHHEDVVSFGARQLLDMVAPSNF